MIVTVTPNPSVDRTMFVERLERGAFIRASASSVEAGGKGINVARALVTHGIAALAVVPASIPSGGLLRGLLGESATLETVDVTGDIRTNITIVEPDGTTTKVNEAGPNVEPGDVHALIERVAGLAKTSTWMCGCGSIPPGMQSDFYARLVSAAPSGVRVAVDADGEPLRAAIGAGVSLVKPNREELERLVGRPVATVGDVVNAARSLLDAGVGQVLVSLGADGAVLVAPSSATHGEAPGAEVVNTVGAGDALLAGFLACGADRSALPEAIAWSVAACGSPGTRMRPTTDADRALVVIHPRLDPARRLVA